MSGEYLSVGLDVVVLIFLGVTIYYALKLSKSLNSFRAYRQEFNALIVELGKNIEEAHHVIEKMKNPGDSSGSNLEALIKESSLLADELQFINEAGNSLASRLEGLAEKNSRIAREIEGDVDYDEQLYKHVEQVEKRPPALESVGSDSLFAIQDRDFGVSAAVNEGGAVGLKSQAERELFQALQRNKKQAAH